MDLFSQRTSGVLMHPTSLPGPYECGDIGPEAFKFIDFLAASKQSWWQMLPVNPIGPGFSPYSTPGSLAGEPLLISIDGLVKSGWLPAKVAKQAQTTSRERVNYQQAVKVKTPLFRLAFDTFRKSKANLDELNVFAHANSAWLEDYVLFVTLCEKYGTKNWSEWPAEIRTRDVNALNRARSELKDRCEYQTFLQFCFYQQWQSLRDYAAKKAVKLIGDLPIFVSYESSDVWANQKFFALDNAQKPYIVAGVPPDYFNKDGQLWGNALYRWDELKKDGYSWWIDRFRQLLVMFDVVRIDHFIGFYRCWEIPATAKTAKTGKWFYVPGEDFFTVVKQKLGQVPFIAEDLGLVTPEVAALRDKFQLPGMRIFHFGFANDGGGALHRTHNYVPNCIAYTGTHDNETTVGWFKHNTAKNQRKKSFDTQRIIGALGSEARDMHWRSIRMVMESQANTTIFPMQDVLGLGATYRMNTPGTAKGNWVWRMRGNATSKALAEKLATTTRAFDRQPSAQTDK